MTVSYCTHKEHNVFLHICGMFSYGADRFAMVIRLLIRKLLDAQTNTAYIPTWLHSPLSTSSNHTSHNISLLPLRPPTTISSGRCPVVGPAKQQVAWLDLGQGFLPAAISLVQCCNDTSKYMSNYAVFSRKQQLTTWTTIEAWEEKVIIHIEWQWS